jgi:hypothetical protein
MRSTPQRCFSWFVVLSFAVILAVAGTAAAGRDLGLLADTLSSNFFAQQVSTICSADNPRFQQNAIGKLGDASAYASLVKREIVMNLPASEAEALVREASQSARSEALELLKRFSGGSNVNVSQLQEWCFTAGLPYIRKLQSIYDDHHDEFERQVDAAKK